MPQVSLSNCNRSKNILRQVFPEPVIYRLGASRLSGKFRLVGYSRIRQTRAACSADRETEKPNLGIASPTTARKIPIGRDRPLFGRDLNFNRGAEACWRANNPRPQTAKVDRARLAGAHGVEGGDRIHLPMARPRTRARRAAARIFRKGRARGVRARSDQTITQPPNRRRWTGVFLISDTTSASEAPLAARRPT
jgi:hypothetical protein